MADFKSLTSDNKLDMSLDDLIAAQQQKTGGGGGGGTRGGGSKGTGSGGQQQQRGGGGGATGGTGAAAGGRQQQAPATGRRLAAQTRLHGGGPYSRAPLGFVPGVGAPAPNVFYRDAVGRDYLLEATNAGGGGRHGASGAPAEAAAGGGRGTFVPYVYTVKVKNLPVNLSEEELEDGLRRHFSCCGRVVRVVFRRGVPGEAYVGFQDASSCGKALAELQGSKLRGSPIAIEKGLPTLPGGTGYYPGGSQQRMGGAPLHGSGGLNRGMGGAVYGSVVPAYISARRGIPGGGGGQPQQPIATGRLSAAAAAAAAAAASSSPPSYNYAAAGCAHHDLPSYSVGYAGGGYAATRAADTRLGIVLPPGAAAAGGGGGGVVAAQPPPSAAGAATQGYPHNMVIQQQQQQQQLHHHHHHNPQHQQQHMHPFSHHQQQQGYMTHSAGEGHAAAGRVSGLLGHYPSAGGGAPAGPTTTTGGTAGLSTAAATGIRGNMSLQGGGGGGGGGGTATRDIYTATPSLAYTNGDVADVYRTTNNSGPPSGSPPAANATSYPTALVGNKATTVGGQATARAAATVIVSNVPCDLTASELQDAFAIVGTVLQTELLLNSSGYPTGRVAITYSNRQAAVEAVRRFDGGDLNAHTIRVFLE